MRPSTASLPQLRGLPDVSRARDLVDDDDDDGGDEAEQRRRGGVARLWV